MKNTNVSKSTQQSWRGSKEEAKAKVKGQGMNGSSLGGDGGVGINDDDTDGIVEMDIKELESPPTTNVSLPKGGIGSTSTSHRMDDDEGGMRRRGYGSQRDESDENKKGKHDIWLSNRGYAGGNEGEGDEEEEEEERKGGRMVYGQEEEQLTLERESLKLASQLEDDLDAAQV